MKNTPTKAPAKAKAKIKNNYSVASMTGFASLQQDIQQQATSYNVNLELRSVNSRFLDLYFRLPEECRSYEMQLREIIGQYFKRGKIEVKIQWHSSDEKLIVEPSVKLLQQLNQVQEFIQSWLPRAAELTVKDVFSLASNDHASGQFNSWTQLGSLLHQACQQLDEARRQEGARLRVILLNCKNNLAQLVTQVSPLVPQLIEKQSQKFQQRWQEIVQLIAPQQVVSNEAMQEKALNEVTSYALRIDVAEEIDRLTAHMAEIEQLLSSTTPVGKKLDFIMQELNREANTLGAKSGSLELNKIAVEMKVLIEQMREQVQNIE